MENLRAVVLELLLHGFWEQLLHRAPPPSPIDLCANPPLGRLLLDHVLIYELALFVVFVCACLWCASVCFYCSAIFAFELACQTRVTRSVKLSDNWYRPDHQQCPCRISRHLRGAVFAPPLSIRCPSSKLQGPRRQLKWRCRS